jgi:hypothetical protein
MHASISLRLTIQVWPRSAFCSIRKLLPALLNPGVDRLEVGVVLTPDACFSGFHQRHVAQVERGEFVADREDAS